LLGTEYKVEINDLISYEKCKKAIIINLKEMSIILPKALLSKNEINRIINGLCENHIPATKTKSSYFDSNLPSELESIKNLRIDPNY